MHHLKLLLESLRWFLIKYQRSSKDLSSILVRQAEVEILRGSLLCLEHDPRWKAKVTNAMGKRVVVSILAL
jgi:hypothetical protein